MAVILKEKKVKISYKNSLNDWQLWGVSLCSRGMKEALDLIGREILVESRKSPFWIATVNPEFMMQAKNNVKFHGLLNRTDLNVIDGVGLVWAKMILGQNIGSSSFFRLIIGLKIGIEIIMGKHREILVPGCDLMELLVRRAKKKRQKVFFLGGFENRAQKTGEYFGTGYAWDWSPGLPTVSNEDVINHINKFQPDLLFVALGMRTQEEWIDRFKGKLKVKVVMGVGRSFDYFSGSLERAPEKWQKMGLEWFYSLIKQPQRWKRQVVLPRFILNVIFGDSN